MSPTRTSRRLRNSDQPEESSTLKSEQHEEDEEYDSSCADEPAPAPPELYYVDGVAYSSYQDMVTAKRRRNQKILEQSGLLEAVQDAKLAAKNKSQAQSRGLSSKRKAPASKPVVAAAARRKSSRLQGIESDGLYVDDERAGKLTVRTEHGGILAGDDARARSVQSEQQQQPEHYRNRINDGEALSVAQAVENSGSKWLKDDSVEQAELLMKELVGGSSSSSKQPTTTKRSSPTSVASSLRDPTNAIESLSANDDNDVAKVCPDRIYSMAVHPSMDKLVVCAGDKVGHIGIWNVDNSNAADNNDGVHLMKPHSGAVSCLEWTTDNKLFSASYDGTCRLLDVEAGHFEEIFATYDDNATAYKSQPGFGLDTGSHFWTQYGCIDRRNEKCLFLSTSVGTALHVDLLVGNSQQQITWHEELSLKKINTLRYVVLKEIIVHAKKVHQTQFSNHHSALPFFCCNSLHPNGYSLISAGLDCTVNLWDLRKMGDSRTRNSHTKAPSPLAYYNGGRSVNSAFFSPSGQYVVSTTMANKLDVFHDLHVSTGGTNKAPVVVQPTHSIRHDNMTGRWLTTFQATFHPALDDFFAVGSMRKPRCVELFDPAAGQCLRAITGDALTAVVSRLAFHRRTDKMILVGGNSSGRVTIVR